MNNFPITNEDFNSKFSYFSQKAMLPKFEWGKKLYIEYEGKVRAAIPYYSAAVSNKKKTGCPSKDGWKTVVCFNIAGIGKKLIKWEIYLDSGHIKASTWNLRLFKTTEDYERFISGEKNQQYVPDGVLVKDILRVHGYGNIKEHECWYYKVYGWCWNYEEPRECPLSFKDCWLNDEGGHITVIHEGWGDQKYPAYLTREECLAANRKQVEEFDEPNTEPEGIMDETNGHNPNLVKEINEKWDKLRPFFKTILCALYERDMEEIYNSDAFRFEGSMDDAFKAMCDEWDFHAANYLQHIADDQDLETILTFVRYDVYEDYS